MVGLATLLFLGGFLLAALVFLAGMNDPTGRAPWGMFFAGGLASAAGLLWLVVLGVGWLS